MGVYKIPVKRFRGYGKDLGVVQAAERGTNDETRYDSIWVRDTAWVYFGLVADPSRVKDAGLIIKTLLTYFATPDQLHVIDNAIRNPLHVDTNPHHPHNIMNAPHIRFTVYCDSANNDCTMKDVYQNGRPQMWNHVQNDALGLFMVALFDAIEKGIVDPKTFSDDEWKGLLSFPPYFKMIKFHDFEDAGAWEENRRKNTSSIGIVTHALERLHEILYTNSASQNLQRFRKLYQQNLARLDKEIYYLKWSHEKSRLEQMINDGYSTVLKQLAIGGESPDYNKSDSRYRTADAALLSLIFPAPLKRLQTIHKLRILQIVETLVKERGTMRYVNDSYQCANYWFGGNRGELIRKHPGTEAEWFFDSWLSTIYGQMFRETKNLSFYLKQIHFLNRSLSQLTPERGLGADGEQIKPYAFPESANTIVLKDSSMHYLPSIIAPLNWAVVSNMIAFKELIYNAQMISN